MSWRFSLLNRFEDPPGGITEGPAWNGEVVLFTHIHASRIYAYNPKSGEFSVFRENTNRTNGLAFDADGRLFGCCQNGRAIVRFDPDGSTVTIADNLDGVPLNTPNDLAIDRQGRIWFTNPWNAGNIDPHEVEQLDHRSILCAVPQADGSYNTVRSTYDTTMPNGILVSPDGNTLYVAESNSDEIDIDRELRAYPINDDGSLGAYKTLHTFGRDANAVHRGIDGMCLDADGNIVATAGWPSGGPGPMLYVFSPTGRIIETHPVAATRPTNVCFGGADNTDVFVTSTDGHFFHAKTDTVGWAIYP